MSSIRCAFLERVTEVGVEGIVHAIVAAGRQTVVETKRPGAVLSGDAQRGLNRVGIHNASDALDAARVGCNRTLSPKAGTTERSTIGASFQPFTSKLPEKATPNGSW